MLLSRQNSQNGMVSLFDSNKQLQEQNPTSVLKVVNSPLKIGVTKLSEDMENVCGIRMRYEQNLNKSTLNSLIVLNPECQIKILEKNLKFLFREDASYNYFQMKSNLLSLRAESKDSVNQSEKHVVVPNPILTNGTEPTFYHNGIGDGIPNEKKNRRCLDKFVKNKLSDRKVLFSVHTDGVSSNTLKYIKSGKNKSVLSSATQLSPVSSHFFDKNVSEENNYNMKDADNQYEFTLEQENIVSFVCSTTLPEKQTEEEGSGTELNDGQAVSSDHESDRCSKLWTSCNGESDSISECASSTLNESTNKANSITNDDEYLSKLKTIARSNKILWHPPTSLNYDYLDTAKPKILPYPAVFTKLNVADSGSDMCVSLRSSIQKKMESSFFRETTLFRETSLRGCYNMENLVKNMVPPQAHVQQELNKVRESIFSTVGLQQSFDDLVSDSILSILGICKSWLKLSSHLKGKEFMDILESNVIDSSVLNDFLQWQCVSRVFIDKMIDTLQNITPKIRDSNVGSNVNGISSLTHTDVKNFGYSPGLHSMHSNVNSTNTSQSEKDLLSSTCEINLNKNWKQRRFFPDQPKQVILESKTNSIPYFPPSNIYSNCSQTYSQCGSDNIMYGQGAPPISYSSDSQFCKINNPFPVENNYPGQGDVNFSPNSYNISHSNGSNFYPSDKTSNLTCASKSFKNVLGERGGTKSYQTSIASNMTNRFPTQSLPMNVHSQALNNSVVPPLYDSQVNYSSSSNYELNQFTVNQNPIQCTDSDTNEKCTKNSYMKPGSYNIPEKPIGFQKIINNNIPIEDLPVVGVPFLFSGAQGSILSPTNLPPISTTEKQVSIEDDKERKSVDKWKAALTSAETFRDNLIASKVDAGPNLKLSDTVSLKSHYLLSDEFSQGSSINDFRLSSGSEEISPYEKPSPVMDVSFVEAKVKTSDWLMQSFNRAVLVNGREAPNDTNYMRLNSHNDSEFEVNDLSTMNCRRERLETKNKDGINNHHNSSCILSGSQNYFEYGANEKYILSSKAELSATNDIDKKSKTYDACLMWGGNPTEINDKLQDDLVSGLFDHKSSLFHKKTKSIFQGAITKPISNKLEDILNCICSTEVSSLLEFDRKSQKEVSKLEIKVRCPLYLQAMRCKLANHSYDTLDQALSDFQKYFMDIRNRNKGDKQSTDIVGALEHLFLDLVEKHFGSHQHTSSHQFFGLKDLSTVKARKSKRISRRF